MAVSTAAPAALALSMGRLDPFELVLDVHEIHALEGNEQQQNGQHEADVPYPVDYEGFLAGVSGALPRVPEADQQVGAQPDAFPAHEHEQVIVRHYQDEHGTDNRFR